MPIRILIADDHAVVRSGLRALLRVDPDLEVVGEAEDGVETLRLVETLRPDTVLLDVTMPPENGIVTAKRLKEEHPELVVLDPHHARGREPAARSAARWRIRLLDQASRGVRDHLGHPCCQSWRHLRASRDDPRAPSPAGHDRAPARVAGDQARPAASSTSCGSSPRATPTGRSPFCSVSRCARSRTTAPT